jgi:ubiquinone/menaquinone biosynthesis C-methylase UbiE
MSTTPEPDRAFVGDIPAIYDRYLVPLIFESYARDLAARVADLGATSLLEVAAGTGAVTRELASRLPASVAITSTDLNQPMLDRAAAVGIARPVVWQQADVMDLPFADGSFDVVVCQFGAMFFPDRPGGFAEIRRVLRPGGTFLFNVWDGIEANDFTATVVEALTELFADNPPVFLATVAHGYRAPDAIRADLAAGGFSAPPRIEAIEVISHAESCEIPAIGFCQGSPMRNSIESDHPGRLDEATQVAAAAVERRHGATDISGRLRAYVVTVPRD